MKLAIIGPQNISVENLEEYIPSGVTEIISGRNNQIGRQAAEYAKAHALPLTEIFPNVPKYYPGSSLLSDAQIADLADVGLFFWDGISRWTRFAIVLFEGRNKKTLVIHKESDPTSKEEIF